MQVTAKSQNSRQHQGVNLRTVFSGKETRRRAYTQRKVYDMITTYEVWRRTSVENLNELLVHSWKNQLVSAWFSVRPWLQPVLVFVSLSLLLYLCWCTSLTCSYVPASLLSLFHQSLRCPFSQLISSCSATSHTMWPYGIMTNSTSKYSAAFEHVSVVKLAPIINPLID